MPAPIKGLEKLIKSIRETSDTGTYKVTFEVHPDGKIHGFRMDLKGPKVYPQETEGTLWDDPDAFNSSLVFMEHGVPEVLHMHSTSEGFYNHPDIRAITYSHSDDGTYKAYLFGLPVYVDDRYPRASTLAEIVQHSIKMCRLHNNDE